MSVGLSGWLALCLITPCVQQLAVLFFILVSGCQAKKQAWGAMGRSGVLTVEMGRVMGVCITPEATQAHDKDRPFLDLQECRLNICLPPVCSGGARLLPPLSCCLHWVSSISLGCFREHIWHLKYSHYDRCSFHPSSPGLSSIKLAICKSPLFNVYHTLNFIFIYFFYPFFFLG